MVCLTFAKYLLLIIKTAYGKYDGGKCAYKDAMWKNTQMIKTGCFGSRDVKNPCIKSKLSNFIKIIYENPFIKKNEK